MTYIEALTELEELMPKSWKGFRAPLLEDNEGVLKVIKLMGGCEIVQHKKKWSASNHEEWFVGIGDTITEAVVRLAVKVLRARKEEANGLG